jgi:hypothetical protein
VKENSREEDVKILEEMIENANIENMDMNDCFGGEHILLDYKRVLKENEKLKALDSSNSKMIANMSKRHFQDREKIRNSIPIQKVKDKIEELKEKEQGIKENEWLLCSSINHMKIQVLQELLESEE